MAVSVTPSSIRLAAVAVEAVVVVGRSGLPWWYFFLLVRQAAISGVAFAVVGVVKDLWFGFMRLGVCGFGGGLSVVSCRCCQ